MSTYPKPDPMAQAKGLCSFIAATPVLLSVLVFKLSRRGK